MNIKPERKAKGYWTIFTRLNIGKIGLTNAELIKALFLNRSNFKDKNDERLRLKQNEISCQWDTIECTLQNEEFWLFLNPKDYRPITRIELILNIICENDLLELFRKSENEGKAEHQIIDYEKLDEKCKKDENRLFRYFYEFFSDSKRILSDSFDIQKLWNEKIQTVFNAFNEWYSDIELYHYVGFILSVFAKGKKKTDVEKHLKTVKEIYDDWNQASSKQDFRQKYLIEKRIKDFIAPCKNLDTQYTVSDKRKALPLLLLHNIKAGMLSTSILIPQIRKTMRLPKKIKELVEKELGKPDEWTDEEKNKIWNYALLDSSTNRSYGNMIFSGKRRIIAAKDRGIKIGIPFEKGGKIEVGKEKSANSAFIPVCTRNIFQKYYSASQGAPNYWLKEIDASAYKKDILDKLGKKFGVSENLKG